MSIVAMSLAGGQPLLSTLASVNPPVALTPPPAANIVFGDDFRDNSAGWTLFQDASGGATIESGRLVTTVSGPDRTVAATAPIRFDNFSLETDSGLEAGAVETRYGLIFRRVDASNFYLFEVDGLGTYRLGKIVSGSYTPLVPPTASERVQPGLAMNRLRVHANGSRIIVGVNGVDVDAVDDTAFSGGAIGVSTSLLGSGEARVVFGNLQVSQP
ncbi:MAG: hypothetical protein KIS91_04580 [Anaerolineae bacterium]|nr:hypothetical protein [Anaerolineae bacterium]